MTEELKVIISAEVGKLQKEMQKGKKEVEDFSKKSKISFEDFNGAVQKAGDVAKKGMAIAAGAIAAGAAALLALGSSTKEYRENQAKLNTAFEAANSNATDAAKTYNDLYRVLGDDDVAVEAANHLAKLTNNTKDLQDWTWICQGVYATFGDSLPIEGLTEAANETARVGALTGPLADALNWAGVSEDDFNAKLEKCTSTQEREALIRETLTGLYGEAARGYEENAAGILAENEAQAKLNEQMAKLGEAVAPVQAALAEMGATIAEKLAPHIQKFMDEHGEALKQTLTDIADAIGKVINWIAENWELVSTLAVVITAISIALGVFSTVMGIVNAVMMASPVTWIVLAIVAAIAALVAIIVLCIKYWDEIKAVVMKVVNAIVDAIKAAWDWLSNLFTTIVNWISEKLIKPVKDFFKGLWDGIVSAFNAVIMPWIEIIKRAAKLIQETVIQPIKEKFDAMVKWFKETIIQPISNFFKNMWNGLKDGAKAAWDGITSVFSKVTSWFKDKFSQAWAAVKNVFSVGGKIFDGIKDGIANVFKTVVNGIIGGINKVIAVPFKAINNALSKIKNISILGVEPFTWIKTFSIPEIPKLARGGIVDGATIAQVGENGREAIVPLENNLEWLDKLANKFAEKTGGGVPVVLNVDGKVFAQTAINTINANTKQTGSLQLNIM
jgi:hypothetical protein